MVKAKFYCILPTIVLGNLSVDGLYIDGGSLNLIAYFLQ